MSSRDGTRHRLTGKSKSEGMEKTDKKKHLTEEEAISKASNKWISHFLIALSLSLLTPIAVLIFLPSPVKPKEYPDLSPPSPFKGPLSINDHLTFADRIYENKVVGPESLVIDGDIIYTGTIDGWVNRLYKGEVKRLVQFGKEPCGGFENENTCGRPLGLRMDKNGRLVVCDAYHGLFRVNVATGEYETLYKAATPINGKASKFLNDLDIDSNGRIYFTDSSTEWHRNQFFNIILEGDTSGRLLMYDPKTREIEQLLDHLMFPNGVQLTPDHSFLLVAELSRARILKFDLKSRDFSVWADGLPGFPDNIRYDKTSQTYWAGMASARFSDKLSILDFLAVRPWLRGMVAKVVGVSNLNTIKKYLAFMGPPEPQTLTVEFGHDGRIVSSLQDRTGQVVKSVSEVHVSNGVFYMGSFHDTCITRLDRKKLPVP